MNRDPGMASQQRSNQKQNSSSQNQKQYTSSQEPEIIFQQPGDIGEVSNSRLLLSGWTEVSDTLGGNVQF